MPRPFDSSDLSLRVTHCVRWLTSFTPSNPTVKRPSFASAHNRRILTEYRRHQSFQILAHGPEHSELTRYVSALPEMIELFLRRFPEWNRVDFVINSGEHQFFGEDGETLSVYNRHDILLAWRDTQLVFYAFPGRLLEQVIARRMPEKLLIRALSQIETDLTQDDEKLILDSPQP